MATLRQRIIAQIALVPMDLADLAQRLGVKEKELAQHLPHIARSIAAKGGRLTVDPAVCRNCGYTFKNRTRLTPPSRCPRCKQSRIDGPWYAAAGLRAQSHPDP